MDGGLTGHHHHLKTSLCSSTGAREEMVNLSTKFLKVKVGDIGEGGQEFEDDTPFSRFAFALRRSRSSPFRLSPSRPSSSRARYSVHAPHSSVLSFLSSDSNSGSFRRKIVLESSRRRVVFWQHPYNNKVAEVRLDSELTAATFKKLTPPHARRCAPHPSLLVVPA